MVWEMRDGMWRFAIPVLLMEAMLGGMRVTYGIDAWLGKRRSFWQVWTAKILYWSAGVWLLICVGLWLMAEGSLDVIRFADLTFTYVLLALVDGRNRIVPDCILVCFLAGQLLIGSACVLPDDLLRCVLEGAIFAALILFFAWVSRGRIGMGDAKLLGVTAMTAGWTYTVQMIFLGLALSFAYSIWLLLFRRLSMETEFPFVPFLAMGIAIHMAWILF